MYHLPAYVALQRWAAGRTVVVVAPTDLQGPRRLQEAGAEPVVVVRAVVPGSTPGTRAPQTYGASELGIEEVAYLSELRIDRRRGSLEGKVDLLVCIEGYSTLRPHARRTLHREASSLLRSGGALAVWASASSKDSGLDYWTLEDELAAVFPHLFVLAELPWQGVSWAPMVSGEEGPGGEVGLALDEGLLTQAPEVRHYLALATREMPEEGRLRGLTESCLLVPVPSEEAAADVSAKLRDLAVLGKRIESLEASLQQANQQTTSLEKRVGELRSERDELAAKVDTVSSDAEMVARQLEVALAEREGARQLSTRVEAELELTRRRMTEQQERLERRNDEWTKLKAETEVLRAKLEHYDALLTQARSREEALTDSAEQGRVLTEVAQDRDRLREELARRSRRITELEENLWSVKEDVQKERLDSVRLGGEVERLREQAERSREAERERAKEVERLSKELHRIEVERAELSATLRVREEALSGMRREVEALSGDSVELQSLQAELSRRADELSRAHAELERISGKAREASALADKRQEQLDEAGRELERMRASLQERSSSASVLQSELEVKSLEVEQLSATVSDLMDRLETKQSEAAGAGSREDELRRQLERQAREQEDLRLRLREKEQELEDVLGAREQSGLELDKLRHELESTAKAKEKLEGALTEQGSLDATREDSQNEKWPGEAARGSREHRLAARERADATPAPGVHDDARKERIQSLRLEVQIRAEEQEYILGRLDAAEQKIWEMNDAASREAARLAASLAQLEKQREQLYETTEELEITRKQLAAAQARALEQERLLASERAKLARRGIEATDSSLSDEDVDDVFAELEIGHKEMVDLQPLRYPKTPAPPKAPPRPKPAPVPEDADAGVPAAVDDRTGSAASSVLEPKSSPRIVVEAIEPDEWTPGGVGGEASRPDEARPRPIPPSPSGSGTEQDTVPRARMPRPPNADSGTRGSK